ncbi:MAG: ABC transporter permease, partial [Terriglobales bacterium]
MRLRGLVRKEFLQILRDPSSIAIAFVMPVVLLLIFGYGLSLDAEHVPLAVVIEQPSADAAGFVGAFQHSRYFDPTPMSSMHEAERAIREHRVNGIIHRRENFARQRRRSGGAPVQVILNGVDANTARLVQAYVNGAWEKWLEQEARSSAAAVHVPVRVQDSVWFNSE